MLLAWRCWANITADLFNISIHKGDGGNDDDDDDDDDDDVDL
jgi:hypothetical protein